MNKVSPTSILRQIYLSPNRPTVVPIQEVKENPPIRDILLRKCLTFLM